MDVDIWYIIIHHKQMNNNEVWIESLSFGGHDKINVVSAGIPHIIECRYGNVFDSGGTQWRCQVHLGGGGGVGWVEQINKRLSNSLDAMCKWHTFLMILVSDIFRIFQRGQQFSRIFQGGGKIPKWGMGGHHTHPSCIIHTLHASYTPFMHHAHLQCIIHTRHASCTPVMHHTHPSCIMHTHHASYTPVMHHAHLSCISSIYFMLTIHLVTSYNYIRLHSLIYYILLFSLIL